MPNSTNQTNPKSPLAETLISLAKAAHQKLEKGVEIGGKHYKLNENEGWRDNLEKIISFCAEKPEARFPKIRAEKASIIVCAMTPKEVTDHQDRYAKYFLRYVKAYYWGRRPLPPPAVNTKSDKALEIILQKDGSFDDEHLQQAVEAHKVCMIAENRIGELLERYIDSKFAAKGWIWCAGNTIRFADFYVPRLEAEPLVIQIKNQANSENSASSSVRQGTKITKWFRRSSKTGKTFWTSTKSIRGKNQKEVAVPGLPDNNDGTLGEDQFLKFVSEYQWAKPQDAAELPSDKESLETEEN